MDVSHGVMIRERFNEQPKKKQPKPTKMIGATSKYFTEFTYTKAVFYSITVGYVILVCCIVIIEWFMPDSYVCGSTGNYWTDSLRSITIPSSIVDQRMNQTYSNQLYQYDICRHVRSISLLYFTRTECMYGRRLLAAVLLGGVVGWERRQADRPAGIRTMALVALGSCLFTINSIFAFLDGPMEWDASRVAAAIPSGVGFLGAGLIFKQAEKDTKTGDTTHVVHGLTTAASLWIVRFG
jgi:putative Mg2+ transporter-C (MgtC) family protein